MGEKKQKDCLLEDEAWRPVCDPGWALAGSSGPPCGLRPLSHCQDPQQHVLLPHPTVGGGGGRFLPTPSSLLIEGKWGPKNCRGGLKGTFTHQLPFMSTLENMV